MDSDVDPDWIGIILADSYPDPYSFQPNVKLMYTFFQTNIDNCDTYDADENYKTM